MGDGVRDKLKRKIDSMAFQLSELATILRLTSIPYYRTHPFSDAFSSGVKVGSRSPS